MDKEVLFKWYISWVGITDLALLAAALVKPEWWGGFLALAALNGFGMVFRFNKEGIYKQ